MKREELARGNNKKWQHDGHYSGIELQKTIQLPFSILMLSLFVERLSEVGEVGFATDLWFLSAISCHQA